MIRVNLLPREEKSQRKAATVDFKLGDMVLPGAVVGLAALVIAGTVMSQHTTVNGLQSSITQVDSEARSLAPQIARVNQLAQERAELDLRMGIIGKLEKGRTVNVLEGVTYSNLVVSDFMARLERSPMFAGVELEVAEKGSVTDKTVVKFRLTCQVTPDESAN